jgi:hypothetical protein
MNYKVGDMLLWDGHIIEATTQKKKELIWESKQGTNDVFEGTLPQVLDYNSSWAIEQVLLQMQLFFALKLVLKI